jgi:hypothetical protein
LEVDTLVPTLVVSAAPTLTPTPDPTLAHTQALTKEDSTDTRVPTQEDLEDSVTVVQLERLVRPEAPLEVGRNPSRRERPSVPKHRPDPLPTQSSLRLCPSEITLIYLNSVAIYL